MAFVPYTGQETRYRMASGTSSSIGGAMFIEPRAASRQRALLLALGVAAFMVGLDARIVAPLLPNIADEFRISIGNASYVVSSYLLPYGVCQLAYGPLADRFGKV